MRLIPTLAALVAVVALAVATPPAPAAANAKKEHPVHGVLTKIDKDKDGNGTITVTTADHTNKKTGEVKKGGEKTFKVTAATTFSKMEKGSETPVALKFEDLKEGMHVGVKADDGTAVTVTVGHHHHGKKKPAA